MAKKIKVMKDYKEKLSQSEIKLIIEKMVEDEKINPKKLKYNSFLRTKGYPMSTYKHIAIYWIMNFTKDYYGILSQVGKAFHRTHVTTIYANDVCWKKIIENDSDFVEKFCYFNNAILEKLFIF